MGTRGRTWTYINTYFLAALWRRDLKWFEIQGIGKRACARDGERERGRGSVGVRLGMLTPG